MEIQVINEGPKVINTKVGDIIRILEEDEDGENSFLEYKVVAVYSYQVLAIAKRGKKKRCFGYGDLVKMGLEAQCLDTVGMPKYEDGRKGARHTYTRKARYGG